eukprot:scaffold6802_cov64-Phaeocystis_antarctica.AAC.6
MVNHACQPPPSAPPSPHRGMRMRVSAVAASASTHASRIACDGGKTGGQVVRVAQFPLTAGCRVKESAEEMRRGAVRLS